MRIPCTLSLAAALLLGRTEARSQRLCDFGLNAGASLDDLSTGYQHDPVIGAHAALFFRVKPALLPGAQGELMLTTLGSDVRVEGYEAELRSVAVRAPVFLLWGVGPAEIHAGAYYERYLTAEIVREFNVPLEEIPVEIADLSDEGYGLLFGAGLHFGHFYSSVRYNMGLSSLGTGPYLDDVKNRQWQAYLGFGFLSTK